MSAKWRSPGAWTKLTNIRSASRRWNGPHPIHPPAIPAYAAGHTRFVKSWPSFMRPRPRSLPTGSAGHKLYNSVNVNRYVGDLLSGVFHGYNPSFSAINWAESNSNSIYNAGTVHLRHPFAKGVTFEAVYTMGRVISDSDNDQTALYQDVNDRRSERGPAAFDVARRRAFSASGKCRSLKGKRDLWECCSVDGSFQAR